MPDLENPLVSDVLRQRITFTRADWAELPLENGSVDAIFATNVLPRESVAEQVKVLKEWVRITRPGGIVFIAQHNFFDSPVESVLQDAGWVQTNFLREQCPAQPLMTGFQVQYSSG
jgi:ubiquinone/menaquinone biosynthesis C-methylase UbiE